MRFDQLSREDWDAADAVWAMIHEQERRKREAAREEAADDAPEEDDDEPAR